MSAISCFGRSRLRRLSHRAPSSGKRPATARRRVMIRSAVAVGASFVLTTAGLAAQTTKSSGPATAEDFDFLEGKWEIVYNNKALHIPPNVPRAWVATKQADGRVLYDEFRLFGPNGETAALGATYRVFDHVAKQWSM